MRVALTDGQVRRYARHILLDEVGGAGQARLLSARALVVGAGGLGSPLLMYLAAAGVGTIGVIDDDRVDLTNLQRQIAHRTTSIGRLKVESAADTICEINPDATVVRYAERLTSANARSVIEGFEIVADGSDNFETRFLLNDACYFTRRPLVSGAILRFEGQVATFKAFARDSRGEHGPCYRCLFRAPPPAGAVPSCAEAGVLGAICGVVGAMQATEVIKELLGIGESLSGRLVIYDGLRNRVRTVSAPADPACPLCGDQPTIDRIG